jgi:hypothetical protein
MATFVYPTSVEMTKIAQVKMPRLTADRPIFNLFPIRSVDSHLLRWEQKDNYLGLQQLRGLDGDPLRVKRVGTKAYQMEPGIYGEFQRIDELELTTRRQFGTVGTPIKIDDLVMEAQDILLGRMLDRIELIGWTLATTGTFSVAGPTGGTIHTDTYSIQTFTAGIPWATSATAVPLANFRSMQLLSRGYSVGFGAGSVAYMNRTTYNTLISNTNANDLGGRRLAGLAPVNNIAGLNQILAGEDLPGIVVYDEGYLDDAGAFQLFIPNNKVVVVGQRPQNQALGEYRMTRNVNNPGMKPGSYMKVFDRGETQVPRTIEVHVGHNGGPVIYYPSAIIVATV